MIMTCDGNIPPLRLSDLCGSAERHERDVIKSVVIREDGGVIVNGQPYGKLIQMDGYTLKVLRFKPDNRFLHEQEVDIVVDPDSCEIRLVGQEN